MAAVSGRLIGTVILCGLLTAGGPSAYAQQAAPAPNIDIMQKPGYLQVMNECMKKAANPPVLQNGQHVDPAIYKMTGDKFQIVRQCMGENGFPTPYGRQYALKGGDNRSAVRTAAPPQAPPAVAPPEEAPAAAPTPESPAAPPAPAPSRTPAPPIYNAPPASDAGGAKPLWVVPQSQ